jgi:2-(1,2-epoxy-1,2-dihydrophenyl)acetyl-CoA isomerase
MTKLLVEAHGRVSLIRVNDPATRNALSMEMIDGLRDLLKQEAGRARAIVLAGGAEAFCSGANLGGPGGGIKPGETDLGISVETHINPLTLAARDLDVPLVCAVRGAAAGFGTSLALLGDLIVAGENAFFSVAFGRIGLIPDGGAPWLLTKAVGRARAMELMLLGEKLPAQQALDWGLINRVVADDAVEATALALAARLAEGAGTALRLTRKAAWAAASSTIDEELARERAYQREAGLHPDFAEGVAAFMQKRKARFGGV